MAVGLPRPWDVLQSGTDLKARRGFGICSIWVHQDHNRRQHPGRLPNEDGLSFRWLLPMHRDVMIESSTMTNLSLQQLKQPSAIQPPRHTLNASSSFAK